MKTLIKFLTAYIAILLIVSIQIANAQLAGGIYTIGSSGTYSSFGAAVTALSGGVSGPVIFNVASGTYTEKVNISGISGTASKTITFQAATGDSTDVILQYAPTSSSSTECFTLRLNNCDYFIFKNITIKTSSTGSYRRVVDITGGSEHNVFTNNQIIGGYSGTPSSSSYYACFYSYTGKDQYNTIKNNYIKNGSYAVRFYGSSSSYETGNQILNNIIENCYYGTYMYCQNAATVSDNEIHMANTSSYGIYSSNTKNEYKILRNKITRNSGTSGYGIYLYRHNYKPHTDSALIANNFIAMAGSGSSSFNGLYCFYSKKTKWYYNSVNMTGSATNARAFNQSGTGTSYPGHILRNNILCNNAGGYCYYTNSAISCFNSNYNVLFTTGTNIGYVNSQPITNLSAWQTVTGGDTNSLSVNPNFTSATDLHLMNLTLNSAATRIASITNDIDGDIRDAVNPDIGADEFYVTPMLYVSCTATQPDTGIITPGSTNQLIIGIEIETNGVLYPLTVTNFTNNTIGSNLASDISNAKLYYTGSSSTFAITSQYGATLPTPSGVFNITGNQVLENGTNYFWLVYDISSTATINNYIDAQCTQIIVSNVNRTPTITNPVGKRKIIVFHYFEPFDVTGNWVASPISGYSWTFSNDNDGNATPSSNTGPAHDHGNTAPWGFMFIEASSGSQNSVSILSSPVFNFSGKVGAEIKFWYHMYGSSMGSLHIDAFYEGIWHLDIMTPITGQQQSAYTSPWLEATVDASSVSLQSNVKFRFRAVRGSGYLGDISIDDITITANNPFPLDAKISELTNPPASFCPGNQPIEAILMNYGTNTLTSSTINWSVNSVIQTPVIWTGSLLIATSCQQENSTKPEMHLLAIF